MKNCVLGIDADVSKIAAVCVCLRDGKVLDQLDLRNTKLSGYERTLFLIGGFGKWLSSLGGTIVIAGLEDYGAQMIALNQARKGGIVDLIKYWLVRKQVPLLVWWDTKTKKGKKYVTEHTVGPTQLSKFIYGVGNMNRSGKQSKLSLITFKETGYEFPSDDLADAFWIAQSMRMYLKMCEKIENDSIQMGEKTLQFSQNRLEPIRKWVVGSDPTKFNLPPFCYRRDK